MASLSAIAAVFVHISLNYPRDVRVNVPSGPRYSTGAYGLGSKHSWWAIPPGRKMKMTDLAVPSLLS